MSFDALTGLRAFSTGRTLVQVTVVAAALTPGVDMASAAPMNAWYAYYGADAIGPINLVRIASAGTNDAILFTQGGTGPSLIVRVDPRGGVVSAAEQWVDMYNGVFENDVGELVTVGWNGGVVVSWHDAYGVQLRERMYGGTYPGNLWPNLRPTRDGGSILTVDRSNGRDGDVWLVKLGRDGSIEWQYLYDLGSSEGDTFDVAEGSMGEFWVAGNTGPFPDGRPFVFQVDSLGNWQWGWKYEINAMIELRAMTSGPTGSVALAGVGFAGEGVFVPLDDGGLPRSASVYSANGDRVLFNNVRPLADGLFAISGSIGLILRDAIVLLVDTDGQVRAAKRMSHLRPSSSAYDAIPTPDGGLLVAGGGPSLMLWQFGPGLTFEPSCRLIAAPPLTRSDFSITPVPLTARVVATTETPVDVTPSGYAVALDWDVLCSGPPCVLSGSTIAGLKAVRRGGDVELAWAPDSASSSANVWYVGSKTEIDRARQVGVPTATGVVNCSAPNPASGTTCVDVGAIDRGSPSVFFYQVRAYCDAGSEGP